MRTTDTHVYFFSYRDIYSNFYPAPFVEPIRGAAFENTEHAFMYFKALFFNDSLAAANAWKETNPAEAKKIGRSIKGFDPVAWNFVKAGYMGYINFLKYTQNPELGKALKETGDHVLVEASPYDDIWGVKLGQDDPLILDSANWRGQNLLGKVLMRVRTVI